MPSSDLSTRIIVQGLRTQVVGANVSYFASLPSTQDEAAAVEDDDPEGAVFITDEQTSGRGRNGRHWDAPPGAGLLLSVQLRPSVAVCALLGMIASLAACRAIEQTTGLAVAIKWPNDLLVNNRKVGGVLVETEFYGEDPHFTALGVGINVNWDGIDIPDAPYPVSSLSKELGQAVSRNQLAIALLNELDRLYLAAGQGESPYDDWKALVATLGTKVRVLTPGRFDGTAVDVSADGALVVRAENGDERTFYAGDVTLHPN